MNIHIELWKSNSTKKKNIPKILRNIDSLQRIISIKMFSSDDNRVIRDVMFTFIIDFITFPSMSTCEFTCDTCTVFFTSL